jgi:HTH-type transcriptional regulator / antitoxin HigA
MTIRPIRNETDYDEALRRISTLMELEPEEGSEVLDELEVLVTLVEAYERSRYALGPASPIETIRFHLERLGWSQAELARRAGIQATHLSAVLNGHRELSLAQIARLSRIFGIPADHLIDWTDLNGMDSPVAGA